MAYACTRSAAGLRAFPGYRNAQVEGLGRLFPPRLPCASRRHNVREPARCLGVHDRHVLHGKPCAVHASPMVHRHSQLVGPNGRSLNTMNLIHSHQPRSPGAASQHMASVCLHLSHAIGETRNDPETRPHFATHSSSVTGATTATSSRSACSSAARKETLWPPRSATPTVFVFIVSLEAESLCPP